VEKTTKSTKPSVSVTLCPDCDDCPQLIMESESHFVITDDEGGSVRLPRKAFLYLIREAGPKVLT